MGDSLEISGNNAVNGVKLDGEKQCINSGDDDCCMSVTPSGDFLVRKRMDNSGKINDTDTGEEGEPIPPHITASPSVDNEVNDNDAESNSESDLSQCLSKMDDTDDRIDDVIGESDEPLPLPITASPVAEREDCLNLERNEAANSAVKSSSELEPSHSISKEDDSDNGNDADTGEEDMSIPPHITASPSFDNEHEYYLEHEVDDDDDGKSNSESVLSHYLSKMNDTDDRNDDVTGENHEPLPLPVTASPSVDEREDCLNPEVENKVANDAVKSSGELEPSHSLSKKDDSNIRNDADTGEKTEPLPPHITADPSVVDEHEDYLNLEVRNEVDDNDAKTNSELDSSHSPSKMDDGDGDNRNDADTGDNDEPLLPCNTASPSVDDEHADDLIPGVENGIIVDDATHNVSRDNESDPSHSVRDKHQPNVASDSCCDHGETSNERCLVDKAADPDFFVRSNSSLVNSAAGDDNIECPGNTVQDGPRMIQESASRVTSETESADSEAEDLLSVTTRKTDKSHPTAESRAVIKPGHEGNETKIESDNTKGVQTDDGLTCSEADRDPERGSSVSTTRLSATDVITSTAQSRATVVISSSLLSSLKVPVLPAKVAVLSGSPAVTPSTAVARPVQQSNKPLVAPVPSTAAGTSSNTRMMSKVLQDVGLLLVSQRVFKNLASIQKRKVGSSQAKCDTEMLQKLKTSHRNLVAKNRGLLMAEHKCSCGFRSESANVIEDHRVQCNFQGRCCYCRGEFVYRTQKMIMKHLWKVHRKVGRFGDRFACVQCGFCLLNFSSHLQALRHMDGCRQKFLLATNLAPKDADKDIPVVAAVKQPVRLPFVVASTQKSQVTAPQISSRNITVSSATMASPGVIPSVTLQLAPAPRSVGPATPLVQIGKQLFTLLPSTTVAASSIALNPSSVKSISTVTLNSAVQTAQNTNTALPVRVDNRSISQAANQAAQAANQAARMPATSVGPPQLNNTCVVCRVCKAFVKDKAALLVHMHIAHGWDGSTHKMCQYCCSPDVTFSSLTELHLHIAKFHTTHCWICQSQFQPPERLVAHLAERHKVTMFKMLQLHRCYFCSSVPPLRHCTEFEEHMMQQHTQQFSDTGKLWDHIRLSPDADKNWYAKRNPDGTLECPLCLGQFISATFLYRHLQIEHSGTFVKLVLCRECGKCVPSNILLIHLIAAHTRKCSVKLSRVGVSDDERIFVPPVGTKRLKNKQGERVSSGPPMKRFKAAAEAVVISDDADSDSDSEMYQDHSSDEDFVTSTPVNIQPADRSRRSVHTRLDRRNSSVDDVHEVLESIVDSGESETVSKRSVGFRSTSIGHASCRPPASAQLCNGITDDEVEIIESIVPTVRDKLQQPASKPGLTKSSDRNYTVTVSTASGKHTNSVAVDVHAAGDGSDVELNVTERQSDTCQQSPTRSKSTLSESSAQQLMAREQIMMNSVEEVLEVDGETVLIVHGDDDDDDEDDDN